MSNLNKNLELRIRDVEEKGSLVDYPDVVTIVKEAEGFYKSVFGQGRPIFSNEYFELLGPGLSQKLRALRSARGLYEKNAEHMDKMYELSQFLQSIRERRNELSPCRYKEK